MLFKIQEMSEMGFFSLHLGKGDVEMKCWRIVSLSMEMCNLSVS